MTCQIHSRPGDLDRSAASVSEAVTKYENGGDRRTKSIDLIQQQIKNMVEKLAVERRWICALTNTRNEACPIEFADTTPRDKHCRQRSRAPAPGKRTCSSGPRASANACSVHRTAYALLCETLAPLTACGKCPGCAWASGIAPGPALATHAARKHNCRWTTMRAFCAQLRKPSRGGRVAGIVDDADDFNAESANSFSRLSKSRR